MKYEVLHTSLQPEQFHFSLSAAIKEATRVHLSIAGREYVKRRINQYLAAVQSGELNTYYEKMHRARDRKKRRRSENNAARI